MDFSSMMSAQMAKGSSSNTTTTSKDTSTPASSKYQRKAEVEATREAAYRAEQAARESERIAKSERKRKLDEEEAEKHREREAKRQRLAEESRKIQREETEREERDRRKRLGLPVKSENTGDGVASPAPDGETPGAANDEAEDIPEDELISKLRALAQPALLFGETHQRRLKRYKRLLKQKSAESTNLQKPKQQTNQPISTTIESVPPSDTLVPSTIPPPSDSEGRVLLARKMTTWFNLVLQNWGAALSSRSAATKSTFAGQSATTSYTQSLTQLRPLFRKLEALPQNASVLPPDLLNPMVEIVRNAQNRRYVDANDGYLKLSIGKAAWPIGVTMVGIHERSAREKLNDGDKAHIMADEATRKILQSIKRCLSYAQTKWPPEDLGQLMG